jgi:hypothetical protein
MQAAADLVGSSFHCSKLLAPETNQRGGGLSRADGGRWVAHYPKVAPKKASILLRMDGYHSQMAV